MITEARRRSGEKLLRVMLFTLMLSSMSAMMFNIVLPDIGKEFDMSLAQVSWMSSAYSLVYAVGTVTYGKLSERFQLRNLVTFGIAVFAAGSLLGLLSQSFWTALLARVLQSAGASSIPAMAMLIPIRYFEAERRGAALGMAAVGLALGGALGPVLSAVLVSFADWRWLFVFPLGLLLTIPYYRKYLLDEECSKSRFDWLGGLLIAAAAGLVLTGFTYGSWPLALAGMLSCALFVVRIRTAAEPFVRPETFSNGGYTASLVIGVLISGIGVSLYFLTPVLLSRVQELPPYWIGFAMVPAAIGSSLLGRRAGRLADSRGNMALYAVAAGLLTACFALLSTFAASPAWFIAAFLVLGNIGQSCMQIAVSNSVAGTLPKEQAGVGMGIFSMCNFLAHGLASGLYGIAADWRAAVSWNPLHHDAGSTALSNVYLALAALHIVILGLFYARFGRKGGQSQKSGGIRPSAGSQ